MWRGGGGGGGGRDGWDKPVSKEYAERVSSEAQSRIRKKLGYAFSPETLQMVASSGLAEGDDIYLGGASSQQLRAKVGTGGRVEFWHSGKLTGAMDWEALSEEQRFVLHVNKAQYAAIEAAKQNRSLPAVHRYDPDQPRDEDGKWADEGGSESDNGGSSGAEGGYERGRIGLSGREAVAAANDAKKEAEESGEYQSVGFRYLPDGEYTPGEPLNNSKVWGEDESGEPVPTDEEQDGVSTFSDWRDMETYTQYSSGYVVLVGGDSASPVRIIEPGEVMISSPTVLLTMMKKTSGGEWVIVPRTRRSTRRRVRQLSPDVRESVRMWARKSKRRGELAPWESAIVPAEVSARVARVYADHGHWAAFSWARAVEPAMDELVADLQAEIGAGLEGMKKRVAAAITAGQAVDYAALQADYVRILAPKISSIVTDAFQRVSAQIGPQFDVGLVHTKALDWAKAHAYERSKYFTEHTHKIIGNAMEKYFEAAKGMGQAELKQLLSDVLDPAFSAARVSQIAVTEVTTAVEAANQEYQEMLTEELGIPFVRTWHYTWSGNRAAAEFPCPICSEMNDKVEQDGGGFTLPNGERVDGPPAHVNCYCFTTLGPK
jgi:hypothetical protein